VQPLAESDRQWERAVIGDQHEDIPRSVYDRGTVATVGKVLFQRLPHFGRDIVVDIIR
jgi:hypothetical protein